MYDYQIMSENFSTKSEQSITSICVSSELYMSSTVTQKGLQILTLYYLLKLLVNKRFYKNFGMNLGIQD